MCNVAILGDLDFRMNTIVICRLGVSSDILPKPFVSQIIAILDSSAVAEKSYSYLHWIHFCLRLSHQPFYPPLQTKHYGLVQDVHHNYLIEWYLLLS